MILGRIMRFFIQPENETRKELMNTQQARNDTHIAWIESATKEASRRFLKLEPTDMGQTHWRLCDTGGELVYPQHSYGASRSSINGYFLQNPQA